MDGAVPHQERDDIGRVPENGEAERNELPDQEDTTAVIVDVVVNAVGIIIAIAGVRAADVGYHCPGSGDYTDNGGEDGEEAEDRFPEEGGIVGVHCGA